MILTRSYNVEWHVEIRSDDRWEIHEETKRCSFESKARRVVSRVRRPEIHLLEKLQVVFAAMSIVRHVDCLEILNEERKEMSRSFFLLHPNEARQPIYLFGEN